MSLPSSTALVTPHAAVPPGFGGAMPPPGPAGITVTPEQKLELLEFWRSVTKRKWVILALALVVAALATVIALAMTPIYKATALVLVESTKGKVLSIDDLYSMNANGVKEHYQTQVEVLKSRDVTMRMVRTLKLYDDPRFDPRKKPLGIRARIAEAVGINPTVKEWTEEALIAYTIKELSKDLSIEPVRLSQLIKVSYENEDPKLAAAVVNALAAEYIDADRDARFKISQNVSSFLQERLTDLREKLTQSEQALQEYREKRGILSLQGSATTIAGQQAGGTNERLVQARARRLELESSYQQVKATHNGDYANVPAVLRDPAVADLTKQANDVKRRLAEAAEIMGSEHPKVKQLETERATITRALATAQTTAVAALTLEYEAARATESSLQKALGSARGEVQNVNREEFQLAVLEREVATNRQLYDMFMSRAKETNLAGDVQTPIARVVDPAVPPTISSKPNRPQIVIVSAVLALFLGALASVLIDRLDNTIKGAEDAELRLKQPVLTAIPQVEEKDRGRMGRHFLDDAHSHFSEAIRTARTGVMLSNLDVPHKTLLITSSLPGEGKTTVSINLALAHAQTKKTLLIDADMRRSQVSRSLNIPAGTKGLSNLVAGTAPIYACIHPVPESTLRVLPVGDLPPNPLELLLSQRFKETLAQLSQDYEMIVIDSPPVELVSEALVLAPLATSTAFVVKAMETPAPLVRKSLARLQRAGANILGVVVNQLDFKQARLYYGEYGASSYTYGGYGYGGKLPYGGKPAGKGEDAAKA